MLLLGITVFVARLSVARGWDMDNIAAPMLTAAGDILTLPSLVVATYLIGILSSLRSSAQYWFWPRWPLRTSASGWASRTSGASWPNRSPSWP